MSGWVGGWGGIGNKAQLRPARLELGLGLSLAKTKFNLTGLFKSGKQFNSSYGTRHVWSITCRYLMIYGLRINIKIQNVSGKRIKKFASRER